MRTYELIFILKPKLDKKEQKEKTAQIEKLISRFGGKIKKKEVWGKKDLAYPIAKCKKGIYIKFNFSFPEEKVKELEEKIKLKQEIIRYLLVKETENGKIFK